MAIVVDASAVVAATLEEASLVRGFALSELAREEWIVPALWWFEVRNAFVINERRGRNSERLTAEFLHSLSRIGTTIDAMPDSDAVVALARKHRLTVYDAAYLELAMRRRLPLATLDKDLAAAARQEGVLPVGGAPSA